MLANILVLAGIWYPTKPSEGWGLNIPAFSDMSIGANTAGDNYRELVDNLPDLLDLCTEENPLTAEQIAMLIDPKYMIETDENTVECVWRYFVVPAHVQECESVNAALTDVKYIKQMDHLIAAGPGELYLNIGAELHAFIEAELERGMPGEYYCFYSGKWKPASYYTHNLGNLVTPKFVFSYQTMLESTYGNHYDELFDAKRQMRNLHDIIAEYLNEYDTIEKLDRHDQWGHARIMMIDFKDSLAVHCGNNQSLNSEVYELLFANIDAARKRMAS